MQGPQLLFILNEVNKMYNGLSSPFTIILILLFSLRLGVASVCPINLMNAVVPHFQRMAVSVIFMLIAVHITEWSEVTLNASVSPYYTVESHRVVWGYTKLAAVSSTASTQQACNRRAAAINFNLATTGSGRMCVAVCSYVRQRQCFCKFCSYFVCHTFGFYTFFVSHRMTMFTARYDLTTLPLSWRAHCFLSCTFQWR